MAVSPENDRMYVTVSKDMMKRIDEYRAKMGLTRSAFCSFLIGQGVLSMDKAQGLIDAIGERLTADTLSQATEIKKARKKRVEAEQMTMTACADCANPCKDDSDPHELAFCPDFRPAT